LAPHAVETRVAVPHDLCLLFLWIAFVLVSVVAPFAILFTGHYPRAIFDFNVGVLRWSGGGPLRLHATEWEETSGREPAAWPAG
jgi:hypothetical protein